MQDLLVTVRRQPGDYQTAKYLLSAFEDPDWDYVSGGIRTTFFDQPFIYGYVWCNGAVEGEVAHSGEHGIQNHGPCPHRIKVCALKKDNKGIVYDALLDIVGPRPTPTSGIGLRASISKSHFLRPTYREAILSFLNKEGKSEDAVISYIIRHPLYGNNISAIRAALMKLVNEGQIACDKDSKDRRNNIYKTIEQ